MPRKEHHVVPNSTNNGWAVKKPGAARASVNTNTKAEAVKVGRIISRRQGSELVIHGKNDDPCPAKDKR